MQDKKKKRKASVPFAIQHRSEIDYVQNVSSGGRSRPTTEGGRITEFDDD